MVFLHSPNILSSTHPLQVLSYPVLKRLQESTPNTKSLPEKMQIEQTQSHNLFTEFYGIFSPPLICLLSDPLSVLISPPPPNLIPHVMSSSIKYLFLSHGRIFFQDAPPLGVTEPNRFCGRSVDIFWSYTIKKQFTL